jgi:hypothetical protein
VETCYGVKLHGKKKMKDGDREWSIPSFTYYAGRKQGQLQTTTNHYAATAMTQSLAEQLTAKLNASGTEATVCDLFADLDTVIYDMLVDIGEEAPPPIAPPTSLARLLQAIEDCFEQGFGPLEVLNYCNRSILMRTYSQHVQRDGNRTHNDCDVDAEPPGL